MVVEWMAGERKVNGWLQNVAEFDKLSSVRQWKQT